MSNSVANVAAAFEWSTRLIALADVHPLRAVTAAIRRTTKYQAIAASIKEAGLIEPPVVFPNRPAPGKYLLLDGHLRIDVLRLMGVPQVSCLLATSDEAFTFNKYVNRLVALQEHRMITSAIARGVPETRIARALNIDVKTVRHKQRLLDGICPEAAALLRSRSISMQAIAVLKRMRPLRQMEVADLMIAMDNYTTGYARSMLAATPRSQLATPPRSGKIGGLTARQVALMERESATLLGEFKAAERSYGVDHLHLVLAKGYVDRLLGSARAVRHLAQHYREILAEFQKIAGSGPGLA